MEGLRTVTRLTHLTRMTHLTHLRYLAHLTRLPRMSRDFLHEPTERRNEDGPANHANVRELFYRR